jgi:hypothetical protein
MAVSILQNPGTLNKSFGVNAITLTGIGANQRYILKVKVNGQVVSHQVQLPNQSGNAVFDLQRVLQNYTLTNKIGIESTSGVVATTEEWIDYVVDFGFEGQDPLTTSPTFTVFGGVKPYYQLLTTESNYLGSSTQGVSLTDRVPVLASKTPVRPSTVNANDLVYYNTIRPSSSHTISLYSKGTFKKAKISYYNEARTLITTSSIETVNTGKFLTIGVGTDSLIIPANTRYYWVELLDNTGSARGQWKAHFFDLLPTSCNDFNTVQFSWLNGEGFRDYYQFTKKTTKNTNVSRETYRKGLIDYNATTLQIANGGRGETVFNQKIEETYECYSDYLSDEDASFLEGLVISPDVRVNMGSGWQPVVLQTNTFTSRSFRTDSLFQMNISFKLANNKKSNRG